MVNIKDFQNIVGPLNVIADEDRNTYAKDYTKNFTPNALAAVFPQTTEQVQQLLKYCSQHKIPVVPSGGRTGLAGAAVAANQELVISLQKMNKIISINKIDRLLYCQAGAITKQVQKAAEDADLFFPVDFASSGSSQIGGNIATNAGGIKVIRYGLMRDWVVGLQVVTASGEILNLDNTCVKNNTGYDLKQLFIGSEGTLGIITECILKLTSPPSHPVVSLFALENLENVTKLFSLAKQTNLPLTAYEFFTDLALNHVTEHTGKKSPFASPHSHFVLLEIEKRFDGDEASLEKFVESASEEGLISDGLLASNSQQAADFWALRENISESLSQTAVVHKNDISLPVSQISQFCQSLKSLIASQYPGFEVVLFGHIGDGNLHVNFVKPAKLSKEEFFKHSHKADKSMFELVKKFAGSISAEHGIGLTKKDFLHFTRSPAEVRLMKGIKSLLDTQGIMNPGKIF